MQMSSSAMTFLNPSSTHKPSQCWKVALHSEMFEILASVAHNNVDSFLSNLRGIPVHLRVGAVDATVLPYFSRRLLRLLRHHQVNVCGDVIL